MPLNNRELAIFIWISIGLGLGLWKLRPGKPLFLHFLRRIFSPHILALVTLLLGYIVACITLLAAVNLWGLENLKTTVFWAFGSAIVLLAKIDGHESKEALFRNALAGSVGIAAVVTFLASSYVFSLAIELALVPLALTLSLVLAISENQHQLAPAKRVTNNLLVFLGAIAIANAIYKIAENFRDFATPHMARELILPAILTALLIPFLYSLHIYMAYENASARMRYSILDQAIRKHALRKIIIAFNFDVRGLKKWLRHISFFRPQSDMDIESSIAEIKVIRKRERNPYKVPPPVGWSPHLARKFIAKFGLEADDYHRTWDGWRASSKYLKIGKSTFDDTIVYYLDGEEFAVLKLILVLHVSDSSNDKDAISKFQSILTLLLDVAVRGMRNYEQAISLTANGDPIVVLGKEIRLAREEWKFGGGESYELELTIDAIPGRSAPVVQFDEEKIRANL